MLSGILVLCILLRNHSSQMESTDVYALGHFVLRLQHNYCDPYKDAASGEGEPPKSQQGQDGDGKNYRPPQVIGSRVRSSEEQILNWGSDLMIKAFACNFYIDGKPNADVVEADYLNGRLYARLSIRKLEDNIHARPLILYSTRFQQKSYGPSLTRFRSRLRLDSIDDEDLVALCNTSMSPFPTANGLVANITDAFKKIAEKEVQVLFLHLICEQDALILYSMAEYPEISLPPLEDLSVYARLPLTRD